MNKKYKIILSTGKPENDQQIELQQGAGARGQGARLKAQPGMKLQLFEAGLDKQKNVAPDYIKVRRKGKDLLLMFEGGTEADLIIEDYYEVMPGGYNALVGQAENGAFYEYIPEDPKVGGLIPELTDGGSAVNVALGGSEVLGTGAALGVAVLGPLAALGLWGAAGTAVVLSDSNEPTPQPEAPLTLAGDLAPASDTALVGDRLTRDNTPTFTGKAPAGAQVELTLNGITYTTTADAEGDYTIEVTDPLPDGEYTPMLKATPANGAEVLNLSVKPFTVDTTPPTIEVAASQLTLEPGETSLLTFTLSEAVKDFTLEDITVTNGTLGALTPVEGSNGKQFTALFTPKSGASSAAIVVSSDRFSDAAGNLNVDGSDKNNAVALSLNTPRTETPSSAPTIAVSTSATHLDKGETAQITFTLSAPSNDFALADVVVTGGTLQDFAQSPSDPLVYTATFVPSGQASSGGVLVGNARFSNAQGIFNQDGADRDNAVSMGITCDPMDLSDTTPPEVSITRSTQNTLAAGQQDIITFTLTETSSQFTLDDISVSGGRLSQFQRSASDPKVYTAVFTPDANVLGQAAVAVAAHRFTDASGNPNQDTYLPGPGYQANNLLEIPVNTLGTAQSLDQPFALLSGQSANTVLAQALSQVQSQLAQYLAQDDVLEVLFPTFSANLLAPDAQWNTQAQTFLSDFANGRAGVALELRSDTELKGAQGAFSPEGTTGQPTVYLNLNWVNSGVSAPQIERVLLEEYGHFIDARINGTKDTRGDEGERFSYEVLGQTLSQVDQERISAEDDRLLLTLDGQTVEVEAASLLFVSEAYFTSAPITLEQNVMTLGSQLPGVKFLFVSVPPEDPYYSGNNVRGNLYAVDADNNVVNTYFGEVSRLIKNGSTVIGCQFYVYPNPGAPSTGTAATTIVFGISTAFDNAYATGSTVKTSSDPVASALNSLIQPNAAPVALADTGMAYMPSCSLSGQVLANAAGNVLSNDSDKDTTYVIDTSTDPDRMVPAPGTGMAVTTITSGATGASATVLASTTSANGSTITTRYGTLKIGADGSYVYDIDETLPALTALPQGSTVTETFTYTVSDGKGGVSTSTLTVTVHGGNNAPTAVNDFKAVNEVAVNSLQASGDVDLNDSDPDTGDAFTVVQASSGQTLGSSPTGINSTGAASLPGSLNYAYNKITFQNSPSSGVVGDQVFIGGQATGVFIATMVQKDVTFRDANGQPAYLTIAPSQTNITFGANTSSAGTITAVSVPSTTVFSVSGLAGSIAAGATVSGEGIPAGTKLTAVNGSYVTLSQAATLGSTSTTLGSGETVQFQTGAIYGQYGYLSLKSDGTYQYFLTSNVPSNTLVNDFFTYQIRDSQGCTSTAVLQIQIQGDQVNPPVLVADVRTINEAPAVSDTGPVSGNVLSNDSGGLAPLSVATVWTDSTAGSPTTVSGTTTINGRYGTLVLLADGSYTYTLNNSDPTVNALRLAGDTLTETFYYRAKDSQTTSAYGTSTLKITIAGANDAPVAMNDTVTAIEASGLSNATPGFNPTGNVLINDTDVDRGDTLSVTGVSGGTVGTATGGSYGSLTLNSDGSYSYVVNNQLAAVEALKPGQTLTDSFTYTVTDLAGATSTATLTVTINGADDTVYAPDIFVNEGSPYAVFSLQSGAGQKLSLTANAVTAQPAAGTAVLDGSMDYTPALQYWNGSAWTAYNAQLDGGFVTVPEGGTLLVRLAIVNDTLRESASGETFTLTATNQGGTAHTATATILDDGTGTYFPDMPPTLSGGVPVPVVDAGVLLNDDRPLTVNSVTVNEGSPYIVFKVGGASEQWVRIGNTPGTATAPDYGPAWEYFDGAAWVAYDASVNGGYVQIPAGSSTLLVRTSITNDTLSDNGETFTLSANSPGGATATGTGTIRDDGSGSYFTADNTTGDSQAPVGTVLNDDRPLQVSDLSVNEASPYAVFTVSGVEGQLLTLDLRAATDTTTAGADYQQALEYWSGAAWVPYTPGSTLTLLDDGDATAGETSTLMVRVALLGDTVPDNGETLSLTATNTGGVSDTGVATILDNGTGDIYTGALDANGLPALDTTAPKDDDRAVTVSSHIVNEASPYVVFTVDGELNQLVNLTLTAGTATAGSDYTASMQYSSDGGVSWTDYSSGNVALAGTGGTLLVRVPVLQDSTNEPDETFTLTATNTAGTAAVGSATLVDDGNGTVFNANGSTDTTTPKDDDRALAVNNLTVNENSPYAVFTVTGAANQLTTLSLLTGTSNPATADGTDYGLSATGSDLEVWNGTGWVAYNAGSTVALDASGKLLVRAAVVDDTLSDNNETFRLQATNTGGTSAVGTAAIVDDGTGTIYADTPDASGNPGVDTTAVKDDDRAVSVSSHVVNEASPYVVFTVGGELGQLVSLGLTTGTATAGAGNDYTASMEYSSDGGVTWSSYSSGNVALNGAGGTLLVRVPVLQDSTNEPDESFTLTATNTGGTAAVGSATLVDDGNGTIFNANGSTNTTAPKDDDRPITVTGSTVNEASPYVMFEVGGIEGQRLSLSLGNTASTEDEDATLGTDTAQTSTLEYFNGTSWVTYTGGLVDVPPVGGALNGEAGQRSGHGQCPAGYRHGAAFEPAVFQRHHLACLQQHRHIAVQRSAAGPPGCQR